MTIFRVGTFAKSRQGIRILTMLILTVALLVGYLDRLHAAEEVPPPTDLLQLQKDLVATLELRLNKIKAENRVGQRTDEDIILAMWDFYAELETACVMEAYAAAKHKATDAQILQIRIAAASRVSEMFSEYAASLRDRYTVGEITEADVAAGKAAALKAAITLATLKKRLPVKAGEPARPCTLVKQAE